MLGAPDGGRALLIAYRRDVEARLTRDQRILHGLVHLIDGDDMPDLTGPTAPPERQLATDLFNLVWTLLEQPGRSAEDDDRMVHAAHASRYHWGQVGGPARKGSRLPAKLGGEPIPSSRTRRRKGSRAPPPPTSSRNALETARATSS